MRYGDLPCNIGIIEVETDEMFFYQYLPIKLPGMVNPVHEDRLKCFDQIIGKVCCDFIGEYGLNAYMDSYTYLTAKRLFQTTICGFNRPGYHSDGFLTNDINYIWCDSQPTVFNTSNFNITKDDTVSLIEMETQALSENEFCFPVKSVLRLNQFNIHKVATNVQPGIRTFLKISFSGDRYDLKGNSHNYLLDYNWEMKDRKIERNIPQSTIKIIK